jgi:hypothetical protein
MMMVVIWWWRRESGVMAGLINCCRSGWLRSWFIIGDPTGIGGVSVGVLAGGGSTVMRKFVVFITIWYARLLAWRVRSLATGTNAIGMRGRTCGGLKLSKNATKVTESFSDFTQLVDDRRRVRGRHLSAVNFTVAGNFQSIMLNVRGWC